MKQHRLMSRVGALVLGLAVAIATLSLASAQQEPPHRFYGTGATAGDMIAVVDDMGHELGSTEVAEDGSWYIDVDRDDADNVSFTLNGMSADADVTSAGSGQSAVVVTAMAMEEDSMDEGDSMEDDDGSMEDLDGEEGSMEDEDSMMDDGDSMDHGDTEYPGTGSGGLADGSGVSAGLIGLLIALSVAAVAGLGLRRVRNRA